MNFIPNKESKPEALHKQLRDGLYNIKDTSDYKTDLYIPRQ